MGNNIIKFFKNNWRVIVLIFGLAITSYSWHKGYYQTIYIVSFIIAIFLPSFFIQKILDKLRKEVNALEEKMNIKAESPKLRIIPKVLGEYERSIYWIFWYFLGNTEFIIFFSAWLALKVAVENKIWTEARRRDGSDFSFHIGRGKFLIFLIGNILSVISVIFIIFFTKEILNPNLLKPFFDFF